MVKITLQLKGPLKKYGPGEEIFPYQLEADQLSLLEIADQFKIPASSISFVTLNEKKENFTILAKGGDSIVFYPRVAGG